MDLENLVSKNEFYNLQMTRCCHFFHVKCLKKYKNRGSNEERKWDREKLGLADNLEFCPVCKSLFTGQQPYLAPTTNMDEEQNMMEEYMDFLSELLNGVKL